MSFHLLQLIFWKKISEIITGFDEFLDMECLSVEDWVGTEPIFVPNKKAQDLKKRCTEIKDSYTCVGLQILILLNNAVMQSRHGMITDVHLNIAIEDLDVGEVVYCGLHKLKNDHLEELDNAMKLSQEIQEFYINP